MSKVRARARLLAKVLEWLLFGFVFLSLGCGGGANPTGGQNFGSTTGTPAPQPAPAPQSQPPPATPSPPPEPASEPDFSVVLLPDTQYYTQEGHGATMDMLRAEMRWIVQHREQESIRAVIGLGDLVQCNEPYEWANADAAYDILDVAGIPYLPLIGTHDYDGNCGSIPKDRSASSYNAHFGPSRLAAYSWYGTSSWPVGSNENLYIRFENAGAKYLVLGLEFYPRNAALSWAQTVLDADADRLVIVATHAFVDTSNKRITDDEPKGPGSYGLTADNSGEEMWQNFIRRNGSIMAVVNGHLHGVGQISEANDFGRSVPQMLSNYEDYARGGDGYLRILRVSPKSRTIAVHTYSPYLDQYYTDPANQFTLKYQ